MATLVQPGKRLAVQEESGHSTPPSKTLRLDSGHVPRSHLTSELPSSLASHGQVQADEIPNEGLDGLWHYTKCLRRDLSRSISTEIKLELLKGENCRRLYKFDFDDTDPNAILNMLEVWETAIEKNS